MRAARLMPRPTRLSAGLLGAAGVQAHPDPDRRVLRPRLGGQRALRRDRGLDRVGRLGEDDEEGVALGALLHRRRGLSQLAQDLAVALAQLGVALACRPPARGASSPRCR